MSKEMVPGQGQLGPHQGSHLRPAMKPIELNVSVHIDSVVKLDEKTLRETKRLALEDQDLSEHHILDLLNEYVEMELDVGFVNADFYDFDWTPRMVSAGDLITLIQEMEAGPPPEVIGQISIEDALKELEDGA